MPIVKILENWQCNNGTELLYSLRWLSWLQPWQQTWREFLSHSRRQAQLSPWTGVYCDTWHFCRLTSVLHLSTFPASKTATYSNNLKLCFGSNVICKLFCFGVYTFDSVWNFGTQDPKNQSISWVLPLLSRGKIGSVFLRHDSSFPFLFKSKKNFLFHCST